MTDAEYMEKAVIIAESNIDPITNQSVGAIIVKDDTIIGFGCRHIFHNFGHKQHKCVHAEHMAIIDAGNSVGATLYVTMEPCAKRWINSISWDIRSCCSIIIDAGIKRVVIGSFDEKFGRDGKEKLEQFGIQVDECLDFEDRIKAINNHKVIPVLQEEFNRFINE